MGVRAVEAVREVVLARPQDLHRPAADRLGDLDRVDDVVGLPPPPEPAAEERRVDGHALDGEPGQSRRNLAGAAGVLRGRPYRARVGRHVGRRVHGLHARVLEVRHLVGRFEGLHARGQGRRGIAVVPRHQARLTGGGLVLLRDPRARELAERTVVPHDLEGLPALERGPEVVGDHGDAARDLDDVLDAGDRLRRGRVEGLDLAAGHDGALLDGRDQHAGDLHVDPVDRLAVDLLRDVDARPRLADVPELVLRLERRVLRDRQGLRLVDELAVQQAAAGGDVDDHPGLGRHLVEGDAPLLGRRLAEHLARRGAGLPQGLEVIADAAAPAVGLLAGDRVRVEARVGRRGLHPDAVPVGVELVRDDHRHRGHRALTHLGDRVDDGDDAVAIDAEPLVGREDARRPGPRPARAVRVREPEARRRARCRRRARP